MDYFYLRMGFSLFRTFYTITKKCTLVRAGFPLDISPKKKKSNQHLFFMLVVLKFYNIVDILDIGIKFSFPQPCKITAIN